MSSNFWTTKESRYGTATSDTKAASKSTLYRWAKEGRTKTRRSQSMKLQVAA